VSIKVWFLSMAVALGLGSAANAATLVNVNLALRYDGTYYSDGGVWFYDDDENGNPRDFTFDNYLADGNELGISTLNPRLKLGARSNFKATLSVPDDQNQVLGYYDNGGRALSCSIGRVDCGYVGIVNLSASHLSLGIDDSMYSSLSSGLSAGSRLYYTFNLGYYSSQNFDWGGVYFFNRTAYFTLLKDAKISPVPLPASAALLPLGLGALTLMRKRRRKLS
jgi:hypothetical protein